MRTKLPNRQTLARRAPVLATVLCLLGLTVAPPAYGALTRDILFPVNGEARLTDSFLDYRDGTSRKHDGVDIFADKLTPLIAVTDGYISWLTETERSYGWMLEIKDSDGWEYWYLHLNNDNPGTDDGQGGYDLAFAPGISQGARVTAGQTVAYVGDSGNAENTAPHLHFEIHDPQGRLIDPYPSLVSASRPGAFSPAAAQSASPDISTDQQLAADPSRSYYCLPGTLISPVSSKAVYYCGANGKRYVFPNQDIYASWYADFSTVQTISDAELAAIPIGGNVTYRPGTRLVKITTDPKVYAVDRYGTLRWVSNPEVAAALYGSAWATQVRDLPDAFFFNYTVGEAVTAAGG
jgi:hypothetical protein